jgi:hypothetical protein
MNNFKILYHFESQRFSLIEIKRSLATEEDKSKLYFWLLFDKEKSRLQKLNFVSMISCNMKEYRVFENARLAFDKKVAVLHIDNHDLRLEPILPNIQLNMDIQEAVESFLDKTI